MVSCTPTARAFFIMLMIPVRVQGFGIWSCQPGLSCSFKPLNLISDRDPQTLKNPTSPNSEVSYVPLGVDTNEFRIAALDTGALATPEGFRVCGV